jgi:hypothetical protein
MVFWAAVAGNKQLALKSQRIVIPNEVRNLLFLQSLENSRFLAPLGMTRSRVCYDKVGGLNDEIAGFS